MSEGRILPDLVFLGVLRPLLGALRFLVKQHYIISVLNLFIVESLNMADSVAFEASPVDKRGFV